LDKALEAIVNTVFLVDALLRLSGLYIFIQIENAFNRKVNFLETFKKSGFIDTILAIVCFLNLSYVGLWLRVLRLVQVTSAVLTVIPHIDVLMVSLIWSNQTYNMSMLTFH
jgi:hypothetical protein